jgi:acyl-CoA thioesterase YciA
MLVFIGNDQLSIGRDVNEASAKPSDTTSETCPTSEPALRAIAMPADTNPHGDIFGGWLLCQMDLAGSTFATRRANGRVVTVAITGMAFHRPVMVGDEVSCFCDVEKIGNTSITVKIQSWVRRRLDTCASAPMAGRYRLHRHPMPSPPFRLSTAAELQRRRSLDRMMRHPADPIAQCDNRTRWQG